MKEYNSNYLGMVIDNNDPEYRGRVQVFIPHIMPALYEGWNQEGKDIQISCVGSNMESSLGDDIVNRLKLILPWAEAASPIIGPSAPGGVVSSGGAGGGSNQFVQSPTSTPTGPLGPSDGSLASQALQATGVGGTPLTTENCPERGNKGCACAVSEVFRRTYGDQAIMFPGASKKYGTDSTIEMFDGMKRNPQLWQEVPYDQQQAGDIIITKSGVKPDGTRVSGHVGISADGNRIGSNSSSRARFELNYDKNTWQEKIANKRPGPTSVFRYIGPGSPAAGGTPATAQQPATAPSSSSAPQTASAASAVSPREVPVAAPDAKPEVGAPSNGMAYNPGAGTVAGTTSGGGTASNAGTTKLATDRQAYFANELNDPAVIERLSYLAWQEVDRFGPSNAAAGTNVDQQTAFIETVVNRAYFSKQSLTNVLNTAGYGFGPGMSSINPATKKAFENVIGGSNITGMATDNASNQFNKNGTPNPVARNRITNGVTGTWYENGKAVSPQRAAELAAEVPTPNGVQFFYTANGGPGYATGAGLAATKYARDNGIAISSSTTGYVSPVSVIGNTYPHGRPHQMNTNDMANGLFAFPAVGAMVWVFFREGNPLYPVYFAASYSSSEWQRAYNGASLNSTGTNTGNPEPHKLSSRTAMNLGGGNSITNISQQDTQDQLNSYSALCVQHNSGSGLTFRDGVTEQYDKNDYFKQTDGNLWNVTHGAKETWISGPSNSNQIGNSTEFYGKWDQESMEASKKLADMCFEYNQKMKSQK